MIDTLTQILDELYNEHHRMDVKLTAIRTAIS